MKDRKIRLLLVEDDKVDQMAFERFAGSENLHYDYTIVGSIAEAKEILNSTSFDVIIADYMLGDGIGFELFDLFKDLPVIITTGTGNEEIAVEAMKLGACDYLIKDPEGNYLKTLPSTVELSLKRKKTEKKLQNYYERLESLVKERTAELETEIVERKLKEKKLRKSEKKYRTLLETTSEGYWLLNHELKTIEVNQSLCNMLGYSQDEMLGKTPLNFVDDENRKIFIEQTSKISTTLHRSYEITLKKKNGQDLHTYFNATTIMHESGELRGAFAFIADITERKQAEEELNRLGVAIEQTAESVFITDRDGTIQYVNPAFVRLTGYRRKDAIGQNPRILKSGKHDALFYKQIWDNLTRGIAWNGRIINKKKDGSFYEADATISPVFDKSGKITNFVSIRRDVTHEIELEKRLIQA
ncbi:MAG: PAS domain S-box protein, partial [Desulfobacterales bacterium]|nr:PAS domain S-box protein [Desulfobacterales bacterium]